MDAIPSVSADQVKQLLSLLGSSTSVKSDDRLTGSKLKQPGSKATAGNAQAQKPAAYRPPQVKAAAAIPAEMSYNVLIFEQSMLQLLGGSSSRLGEMSKNALKNKKKREKQREKKAAEGGS
ncbi:hypothetical protein LIER_23678 [Lithospermum erythrorhizon]|uniref:Uncharacterized protein n=1 Tax=Lithospermum erythrorhizon TaxID=34254 RepID=A0AAV3R2J3_LITER